MANKQLDNRIGALEKAVAARGKGTEKIIIIFREVNEDGTPCHPGPPRREDFTVTEWDNGMGEVWEPKYEPGGDYGNSPTPQADLFRRITRGLTSNGS